MAEQKLQLKDIFTRNLILFMIIQLLSDFSNNAANSFMNMGAKAAGISVGAIGLAASAYTLGAWLIRMPAGQMTNSQKKKLILMGAISFRTVAILVLGTIGLTSGPAYVVTRTIYGVAWGMVGVIVPATAAMLMDKRAMGTTFAVYTAVSAFTKSMVKALGVYVYKNNGIIPALLVAAAFAVAAILLIQFMDFTDEKLNTKRPQKAKKGILASLNTKFIPICMILSFAVFAYTMNQQYNSVLAQERNIDYASILAVCSVISSVAGFVMSAACDFISPTYVLMAIYAILAAATVILGRAETYTMFLIGQILSTIGCSYSKVISIYLFKNCTQEEKGSVQATNFFCTDIYSTIAGVLLGTMITALGYKMAYDITAIFAVATIFLVLFFGKKLMANASSAEE